MEKIKSKLIKFCVYQERCHKEVRNKLLSEQVYGNKLEEIILFLIEEGFLNEERYARSYARGKFRNNKWGVRKIKQNLKQKDVSDYCIRKAIEEIDHSEYEEVLIKIMDKKLGEDYSFKNKNKVYRYLVSRGFEAEIISSKMREFLK